jgi:PAS domain S-box-containing protein
MADQLGFSSLAKEQRFELLVNSVTDYAIYMLEPDGQIATWNPGARRFKQYEAHEIIGKNFSTFFTEEDLAAGLPAKALGTAASEGRFEGEGWRVRKDKTRFWAHVVIDPVRSPQGDLLGFAKITRDITERREKERELYESEQRFRMLVQGVRDYAIYMLDVGGIVTNWNAGAEAIKGYKATEIVGNHFSRFYTEQDRAAGEPARALATALWEGKYESEAQRVRKDGTPFWASVVIDPIFDETGKHVGFAKITRDITARHDAEQELEEARAALFQSQKLQAMGALTGGVAHDFNNLLTVIRGSAELLQRVDLTEEKRRRYLDAIIDTSDRATVLTSHLLAFGRRQSLRPEVIDLNICVDALGEVLARTLGSRIEVVLKLEPMLWAVEADPTHLETALLNAAINARDAMDGEGRLTISTFNCPEPDGDMVCVSIADTGSGMPKEVIDRAFEPFFTTKPVGKGTGLGLSQIHGFAAQTGGRAEIESVKGKGTTIRLALPRTHNSLASVTVGERATKVTKELKILLVEDNPQVCEFASHLLGELGCQVVSATNAEDALVALEHQDFDLLFSDVVMPGTGGLELARLTRARRPDLPILLATGYSEELSEKASLEFQVIRKPYGAEALSEQLCAVAKRKLSAPRRQN